MGGVLPDIHFKTVAECYNTDSFAVLPIIYIYIYIYIYIKLVRTDS